MSEQKPEKFKHPTVTGVVVSKSPPIILGGLHGRAHDFPLGSASLDAFVQAERPMFFFLCPQWSFQQESYLKVNVDALRDRMRRFPQHTYTVLANDPTDLLLLRKALPSVGAFVWNTNCTADVSRFAAPPTAACEAEFDAVYNARFSGYKRLELASLTERLCLISRGFGPQHVDALRASLPGAYIPNIGEDGLPRVLPAEEVATILIRSGCGLMLSEIEGQTRAIMEYLLCGLPVVTTPNYGGRDRFLTPSNSLFAAPDPVSVAKMVKVAQRAGFDRHAIRVEAIRAMEVERNLLVEIINEVIGSKGERSLALEDLHLPHKTSSTTNKLPYFFNMLGQEVPPQDAFVSASLTA